MKTDVLHSGQIAVLLFILTITFKVAALPAMVASDVGSGGLAVYGALMVLDVLGFVALKRYLDIKGIEHIDKNTKTAVKAPIMIVLAVYFVFKSILCFSQTIDFVMSYMFENIKFVEATLVLFIPCVYMATKGARTIARVSEIVIVAVLAVVVFNFLFLKTDADFGRNLPLWPFEGNEFLTSMTKWFFWFGDFLPLLFVSQKESGKKSAILAIAIAVVFVIFTYGLMFAIYGKSLVIVKNAMLKYGVFNHLSDYIGRLDWTVITIWIPMAIITGSMNLWAAKEAFSRIVKNKSVSMAVVAVAAFAYFVFATDAMDAVNLAKDKLKYFAMCVSVIAPPVMLCLAAKARSEVVDEKTV